MIANITHLILFSCGLVWVVADLVRVRKRQISKEYKSLYVENKILLGAIFLALVVDFVKKIFF